MTMKDLIDVYMFDYISTSQCVGLNQCGCCSMVEEMNAIRSAYIAGNRPIEDIIRSCVCNRHGHQYCISGAAVDEAVKRLVVSEVILSDLHRKPFIEHGKFVKGFCDFEELYDFVRSVIGEITGIGPLTIYDTAKRIGHLLQPAIYPKQYVYLAAGAMDGAKKLLGAKSLEFREPTHLFTPYFGTLSSIFIEDMLCIFKDYFILGGVNPVNSTPSKVYGKANVSVTTI